MDDRTAGALSRIDATRADAPRADLGYVVSPHGFGHAARTAAVIAALRRRRPGLRIDLFTTAPGWFFADSLGAPVVDAIVDERDAPLPDAPLRRHPIAVDLGLVQRDALRADPVATAAQLDVLELLGDASVDRLARHFDRALAPGAPVVCDIAPAGLRAAARSGRRAVLVENFTWDWIYAAYAPTLDRHADAMRRAFEAADLRIQTAPVCQPQNDARAVGPISRRPRAARGAVLGALDLDADARFALVTMGGIPWQHDPAILDALDARLAASARDRPLHVVIAGGAPPESASVVRAGARVRLLPHRSPLYHPDLVHAADAVVAKLGYSTVAEIAAAHARRRATDAAPIAMGPIAIGWVPRPDFPESAVLADWVERHLHSWSIEPAAMRDGRWIDNLLTDDAARDPGAPTAVLEDGADAVADAVLSGASAA